jgi:hypothetical protein
MKKKTILLFVSVFAYCYLFYNQGIGINFLIFNVLLVFASISIDFSLVKRMNWLMVATCALITATSAFLYGNLLSVIGNVIALLLLAYVSYNPNSSLVFAFLQSTWTLISSIFLQIEKIFTPKTLKEGETEETKSEFTFADLLKFILPIAVLVTFFLIYKYSNPVFSKFIDNLNLDFISWSFIGFMLVGFYLLIVYYFPVNSQRLIHLDESNSNLLSGGILPNEKSMFKDLSKEMSAAMMTFGLLNLLLLLVNVLDLNFIFSGQMKNITNYSQYVHQGINSSIFSVVIAIFVMLYFFRGNLNYIAQSKKLKWNALLWILLNAILLGTCLHKNFSYILDSGLTYKRIGVYFYLFLTFIALLTTLVKITTFKSNWFLIRYNVWSLFLVLTLSTLFNWDKLIFDYNIKFKSKVEREYYLLELNEVSYAYLVKNWRNMPYDKNYYLIGLSENLFEKMLDVRMDNFIYQQQQKDWRSWNLEDERIVNEILKSRKNVHTHSVYKNQKHN